MNLIDNVLRNERTIDRSDWQIEHITTPRRSCLEAGLPRLQLRRLCIDHASVISNYVVRRLATRERKCYGIGEFKFTFEEALAIVEGRAKLPMKSSLPLEDLPLFRKDAA